MPNSNKNYRLHPSTQSLHNSYSLFLSILPLTQQQLIPPFEELSSDERILFHYWSEAQEKLENTALNSGIQLYSSISKTYQKVLYKLYGLEYNQVIDENIKVDDVG